MAFTDFTNLDFDQIRTSIKDYLRANSTFTDFDFEGSNFSVLIDVLAYNTYLTAYNTNMVANEAFLDSATIRENVVSLARNIGFVPLSRRAARAKISFTVSNLGTAKTLTLQSGVICTGNMNDSSYIFSIPENVTVGVSNGTATFSEIEIYEGTYLTKTFDVNTSLPNQKYILPNPFIDTSTIRVSVQNTAQSTTQNEYKLVDSIVGINSTSQIYLIQEISDEKYELFFGDGIFGQELHNNNRINVSYIVTNGSRGNGPKEFSFTGIIKDNNNQVIAGNISAVTTISPAENGDEIQSTESVRYYAPKLYAAQNRAVTAGDYEAILPSIYPNIESVTAYGGEELTPPQYGKVFLAAKPKNAEALSEATKESILNSLKKYSVAGIQPQFVDVSVLYVELDSLVYYNASYIDNTNSLKTQIINSLNSYSNSTDLNKFGGRFKYSKALRIIDTTNNAITSNITKVRIRRNLGAIIQTPTQYYMCFENRFHVDAEGYNIRSTGFTIQGRTETMYISDYPDSNMNTGKLFLFYFDGETVVKISDIGTVNYVDGILNIDNINVFSTVKPNNIIEIEATPYSNDIIAKKSIYLKLDVGASDINVTKDIISSGENASGSLFTPESSYLSGIKIRK